LKEAEEKQKRQKEQKEQKRVFAPFCSFCPFCFHPDKLVSKAQLCPKAVYNNQLNPREEPMKKDFNDLQNNFLTRRDAIRALGAAGMMALVDWRSASARGMNLAGDAGSVAETGGAPSLLRNVLFAPAPRPAWDPSQLSCVTRPALTEGPFFVDELLNRSDIRSDPSNGTVKPGTPLKIKFNVGKVSGSACTPLAGAFVDLWHCDAAGGYSDVSGQGNPNNLGQKFLRGYQVTDSNGAVEFTTIYPGWYSGRTVHFHYQVRLFAGATRTYQFISQLVFDDALTDQVFTQAPYNARPNRNTRNSNDNIAQGGGSSIILALTPDGAGGYTTDYTVGVANVPDSVAGIASVSAASFRGELAPDSIGAIFGTGLAAGTLAATTTTLPTELGGVQVVVLDANGTRRNAPLFFVSPTQVNFQIPSGTSAGTAFIYVLRSGASVGQGVATIASVAPSLFAANANGQGVAAAVALRVKSDGTQTFEPAVQFNSATNRFEAVPIDLGAATDQVFLIPFGAGFRNRSSLSAVAATIGGAGADVTFAGAQGNLVGLDQANIRIPRSLAGRGNVDLVFTVDSKTANTVSFSIR
jgi:uncharacterized protein (TIGR03437 family)